MKYKDNMKHEILSHITADGPKAVGTRHGERRMEQTHI
jgi:hypothetical protein